MTWIPTTGRICRFAGRVRKPLLAQWWVSVVSGPIIVGAVPLCKGLSDAPGEKADAMLMQVENGVASCSIWRRSRSYNRNRRNQVKQRWLGRMLLTVSPESRRFFLPAWQPMVASAAMVEGLRLTPDQQKKMMTSFNRTA